MIKETKNVKIGLSTEAQVNLEFIEAWYKAEKNEIKIPEERLYFLAVGWVEERNSTSA